MSMDDIVRVHQVKSSELTRCPVCGTLPKGAGAMSDGDELAISINHMLEHGWSLLHIGQESANGDEGPWQHTTAVLGRPAT